MREVRKTAELSLEVLVLRDLLERNVIDQTLYTMAVNKISKARNQAEQEAAALLATA